MSPHAPCLPTVVVMISGAKEQPQEAFIRKATAVLKGRGGAARGDLWVVNVPADTLMIAITIQTAALAKLLGAVREGVADGSAERVEASVTQAETAVRKLPRAVQNLAACADRTSRMDSPEGTTAFTVTSSLHNRKDTQGVAALFTADAADAYYLKGVLERGGIVVALRRPETGGSGLPREVLAQLASGNEEIASRLHVVDDIADLAETASEIAIQVGQVLGVRQGVSSPLATLSNTLQ